MACVESKGGLLGSPLWLDPTLLALNQAAALARVFFQKYEFTELSNQASA
jgi:hypothetical protein